MKWAEDEPYCLIGLVWTFPYYVQIWKRFPKIISFDNIYKTNHFKLPLFQAIGQTCLGTIFNAAFGLIDNKQQEGFQFLSASIHQLLIQHSIQEPTVIITDFDKSMKAVLNHQFPEIQQQLCIHHINSNILLQSKQKWIQSREDTSSESSDHDNQIQPPQAELTAQDKQLIHTKPS